MLEIRALTRRFPGMRHPAVDDLSIRLEHGEILALAGASGSGKTTTLRLVAGFDRPDAGSIGIGGTDVAGPRIFLPPEQRNVGVVFQDFALFPHLSVARNVAFGLPGGRGQNQQQRVGELLEMVGIPELAGRYPHEISGGQQQRVALARALAPSPDIILLDEPFSNLDHTCTHRLLAETRQLIKESGCTAVVVTHDRYEAFTLADRIAVLEQGVMEQLGTAEEIYSRPASRHVAEFAGNASYLPAWPEVSDPGKAGGWRSPIGTVPDEVAVVAARSGGHLAVVRPHHVEIMPGLERNGHGHQPEGTVVDVRFLGAVMAVLVEVAWKDGRTELLLHTDGPRPGLQAGQRVALRWNPGGSRAGSGAERLSRSAR